MFIEKKFKNLTKGEKRILSDIRSNIVTSFNAIVNWEKNSIYESDINLTSDKEDEFPLSDEGLKRISNSIPNNIRWVDVEKYIRTALKPLEQEVWNNGHLQEVYYRWELHYLPIEKMFGKFKEGQLIK